MPKKVKTRLYLDLSCARQSDAAPSCKNYTKLFFDVKHLENGLNMGVVNTLGLFFFKKMPFLANIECCPKFLD